MVTHCSASLFSLIINNFQLICRIRQKTAWSGFNKADIFSIRLMINALSKSATMTQFQMCSPLWEPVLFYCLNFLKATSSIPFGLQKNRGHRSINAETLNSLPASDFVLHFPAGCVHTLPQIRCRQRARQPIKRKTNRVITRGIKAEVATCQRQSKKKVI